MFVFLIRFSVCSTVCSALWVLIPQRADKYPYISTGGLHRTASRQEMKVSLLLMSHQKVGVRNQNLALKLRPSVGPPNGRFLRHSTNSILSFATRVQYCQQPLCQIVWHRPACSHRDSLATFDVAHAFLLRALSLIVQVWMCNAGEYSSAHRTCTVVQEAT